MAAPSDEDVKCTLEKSSLCWGGYLSGANSMNDIPSALISPGNLLCRTPKFPGGGCKTRSTTSQLLIQGQATWMNYRQPGCDLEEKRLMTQETFIGVSTPTVCTSKSLPLLPGESVTQPRNYIAVLCMAWSYILAKFQIEKQPGSISYSNALALLYDDSESLSAIQRGDCLVDIGKAGAAELRWWRAVLASGKGWDARPLTGSHISPWSIRYDGLNKFFIVADQLDRCTTETAAPSSAAIEYLAKFVKRHSLGKEAMAGLASALLLPLHNSLQQKVELPLPNQSSIFEDADGEIDCIQEYKRLPYYLTLSSCPSIIGSALWSIFWQPWIKSNLVSAWYNPILVVLQPLVQHAQDAQLLKILLLRRPELGFLWLGATLTGFSRYIPGYLKSCQAPYSRPSIIASAWVGIQQSFIEEEGVDAYIYNPFRLSTNNISAPSANVSYIRREDRFRILFDVGHPPYNTTPLVPWPPFGLSPCQSCELEVRAHEKCQRHRREYSHWMWIGQNENFPNDYGFRQSRPAPLPLISSSETYTIQPFGNYDVTASAAATRDIFSWNSVNGEGYSPDDKDIFGHEWLAGLFSDSDDDNYDQGIASTSSSSNM